MRRPSSTSPTHGTATCQAATPRPATTGSPRETDRLSTCAFTAVAIHRLLALPERTYQGRNFARLLGGTCVWIHGTGHETIQPFALILCHLPTPRHPHIDARVRAIVALLSDTFDGDEWASKRHAA